MDKGQQINLLTVIAIAVIAYAGANITHEIIGHCGMALLMGTPCTVVSSFYAPLEVFPARWKYNIIVVAGSTANFVVALICLALLRESRSQKAESRRQPEDSSSHGDIVAPLQGANKFSGLDSRGVARSARSPRAAFVHAFGVRTSSAPSPQPSHSERPALLMLWLLMAVNLFLASTYIMAAPIIKFGDSYILIHDLSPQIFWRLAVALAGAIAWWFSFRVCRIELAQLIGAKGREARTIAWQLVVAAYLTGGVVWVASALFSRLDWRIAQLEAAGGSFGLTIWLLLLPFFLPQTEMTGREPLVIPRSVVWIIAGALTALFFIGVWGRGIDL